MPDNEKSNVVNFFNYSHNYYQITYTKCLVSVSFETNITKELAIARESWLSDLKPFSII